jgi:hypothetical protein
VHQSLPLIALVNSQECLGSSAVRLDRKDTRNNEIEHYLCFFLPARANKKRKQLKLCLISANQLHVQKLEQQKAHRADLEPPGSKVPLQRQKNHTARVQLKLAK